ncbi:MAG: putative lipoprotein [Oceanicoccus sp.]|jgi:predicted lipoprotein
MLIETQKIKMLMFSILGCLVLAGCGDESSTTSKILGNEANTAAVQIADFTIIPAVNNFQSQAQLLDNSAELFCSTGNTSETNLLSLQQQWKDTSKAWYQVLPFKFGPVEGGLDINIVEPIYAYVDYFRFNKGSDQTLTVRNKVKEWVGGPEPTTVTDAFVAGKSASLVGFLPLEVTIFETTNTQSTVTADVLTEFTNAPRKCEVLTALSSQLLVKANEIQQGWTSNYAQTGKSYRDMLATDELEDAEVNDKGDSPISKITVSVQDYFDYLKNRDLTTTQGQISNSIWQSVETSMLSVDDVLAGTMNTTLSLNTIMKNNDFESTVALLKENIATLRTAILDNNSTDFKAAAGILDGNFKRDLPDAIGVSLGLNFSDGD